LAVSKIGIIKNIIKPTVLSMGFAITGQWVWDSQKACRAAFLKLFGARDLFCNRKFTNDPLITQVR
jgi:hypothetical protein